MTWQTDVAEKAVMWQKRLCEFEKKKKQKGETSWFIAVYLSGIGKACGRVAELDDGSQSS
jgi:hypothetical protein